MIAWKPALAEDREPAEQLPAFGAAQPVSAGQLAREVPLLLILAVIIAFVVKTFAAQLFYIPSASMEPQLKAGDRVLVSKVSYELHDIHRGDIVVFDAPVAVVKKPESTLHKFGRELFEAIGVVQPSTEEYIKRVIGLPGETVESRDGVIYVNGHELIEPYLSQAALRSPGPDFAPFKVPPGRLWVMGDNRGNSRDSRYFRSIRVKSVVGRAILRVYPFPGRVAFL